MHITFYGQSAFLVELDGVSLLFDPFISDNPKAADIDIASIKPDMILLSHGHGDHIGDAAAIARASNAPIISNYEITEWFAKQGIDNTIGMNLGGHLRTEHATIQLVPAWHSSTMPDSAPGGTAGGFIVTHKGGAFYYSGDTALFQEMKLFARRQKIDHAFLCLGDHFTMDMVDAVTAAEFLDAGTVIGMHFDTFPPIEIDHDKARELFAKSGRSLILPEIGKRFAL